MSSRSAEQAPRAFVVVGIVAALLLQLLGRFDLGRLGFAAYASVDLRVVGAILISIVLLPWWFTLQKAPDSQRLMAGLLAGLGAFLVYLIGSTIVFGMDFATNALVVDLLLVGYLTFLMLLPFTIDAQHAAGVLLSALVVVAVLYLVGSGPDPVAPGRLSAFGGGPNVFGRVVGFGAIAAVGLVAMRRGRALLPVVALALLAGVVMSGSRGAMLATALGLVIVLVPSLRSFVTPLGIVAVLAGLGTFAVLFGDRVRAVFQERVVYLTFEQGYTSGRGVLTDTAVTMANDSPVFGNGLGSFGRWIGQPENYPHNLVLQVVTEGGLLGLLLLLGSLVPAFVVMARSFTRSAEVRTMVGLTALVLVASLFSGDYFDARLLWAFAYAGALVASATSKTSGSAGARRPPWPRSASREDAPREKWSADPARLFG